MLITLSSEPYLLINFVFFRTSNEFLNFDVTISQRSVVIVPDRTRLQSNYTRGIRPPCPAPCVLNFACKKRGHEQQPSDRWT